MAEIVMRKGRIMRGHSWRSVLAAPPRVAWQELRILRHSPPGGARQGDRRATFCAALEQAEQLFSAAADVGTAARPLPLFYGLSQAGRAIAAASNAPAGEWKLKGHGITCDELDLVNAEKLADLAVRSTGKPDTSFRRLTEILGSVLLDVPTRIGDIACLIPEASEFEIPGLGDGRPIRVKATDQVVAGLDTMLELTEVPFASEHWCEPPRPEGYWNHMREEVAAVLNRYPSLEGWQFPTGEGQIFNLTMYGQGMIQTEVLMPASKLRGDVPLDRLAQNYRGVRYAFPGLGGSTRAAHPLLVWWAVLYSLSMIARYVPDGWGDIISVNSSAAAIPVEHLLTSAAEGLPELIFDTIAEVASWPRPEEVG